MVIRKLGYSLFCAALLATGCEELATREADGGTHRDVIVGSADGALGDQQAVSDGAAAIDAVAGDGSVPVADGSLPPSCNAGCIVGQQARCGGCGVRTCSSAGAWGNCQHDSACQTQAALSVAAPDSKILLGGRWDQSTGKPRCNWAGCSFRIHASAKEVFASIADGNGQTGNPATWGTRDNELTCYVDGKRVARVVLERNVKKEYQLVTGLSAGPHLIECRKSSEAMRGMIQLDALRLNNAALHAPIGWSYKMLFIGDSISAGAGNLGYPTCNGDAQEQEDTARAYTGLTALAFDAETTIAAVSGIKAQDPPFRQDAVGDAFGVRNLYSLPVTPAKDSVQIALINLGTNDGGDSPGYRAALGELISGLRGRYGNIPVVLVQGPMNTSFDAAFKDLMQAHSGLTRVDFPFDNSPSRVGCTSHPNLPHHADLAKQLVGHLQSDLKWCRVNP
ncbi:MAG: hypothetical protein H6707_01500 [Deltaproteobacteria bacterium]|nr:hypothetical protein [Deltaproteobacteria bacterium]